MTHTGSERWRGGLARSGAARTPPLAVGDVLDVPGFEFLLQPVYWLVLAVEAASLRVVAIDRGARCGDDLHLQPIVGGEGLSGWTVRRHLVRLVESRALPPTATRIGVVHAQLRGELLQLAAGLQQPVAHRVAYSAYERKVHVAAARLLPAPRGPSVPPVHAERTAVPSPPEVVRVRPR